MRTRSMQTQRGFTLIEVMAAMAMLGFGLLALSTLQIRAMKEGGSGWRTNQAAVIARDALEVVQRLPWAQVAATGGFAAPPWISFGGYPAGDIPVTVAGSGSTTNLFEVYSVRWRVTDNGGSAFLRDVDIQVSWNEDHFPNRQLTLSTLRYNR